MNIYNITVLCEDEDGSRTIVGNTNVEADDLVTAQKLARDELWDERLTGYCLCRFKITELLSPCPYCRKEEAEIECGECEQSICESCLGACCGT